MAMSWRSKSTISVSCVIQSCESARMAYRHGPASVAGRVDTRPAGAQEGATGGGLTAQYQEEDARRRGGQRGVAMGEQIDKLAQFVAETQWEEIPDAVRQHAKLVLLDTLGVILAGAEQHEVQQLRER